MNRGYGILLPLFSLPSGHGIGDFGPASYSFVDLLAHHGAGYWQVLPLSPGNPENGESPYFSTSAFAINPLLISLEGLSGLGLLSVEEMASMPKANSVETIYYSEVRRVKMPLLEKAAQRVHPDRSYELFCQSNRFWLDDFALFEVARQEYGIPFPGWPFTLRQRDSKAVEVFGNAHGLQIETCRRIQFFAWNQWRNLRHYANAHNVTIIGDMPIYVAHDSADVWRAPELFRLDNDRHPIALSGVPPDYFSATGQLWNNPVYDWKIHLARNFSWWVERMRYLFSLYDMVRIDHFRGLVQYWEIPEGEVNAMNGNWKDVPTRKLFDALLLELKKFPVLCEDLGIITDDVRRIMRHYGFPGMKVLQFAFDDDDPKNQYLPLNYEENCCAYTGTHDNLPTLAWVKRLSNKQTFERVIRLVGKQPSDKEIVWALIEEVMRSKAAVAIFPVQDILCIGEESRINDPANVLGNWKWRWNRREVDEEAFTWLAEIKTRTGR